MNGQPEAPHDRLPPSPDLDNAPGDPAIKAALDGSTSADGLGFAIPVATTSSLIAPADSPV